MADSLKIDFRAFDAWEGGDLVIFVGENLKPGAALAKRLGTATNGLLAKAAAAERFKGKAKSAMTVVAPASLSVDRIVMIGLGSDKDLPKTDFAQLGGIIAGKVAGRSATVVVDLPGLDPTPDNIADLALGARLRGYSFDRYKTKKDDNEPVGTTHLISAGRGSRRHQEGSQGPRGGRGGNRHRARSRQRAAQCPQPEGIRGSRRGLVQGGRRGRDPQREGDGKARHAGAARRGAGLGA